MEPRGDPQGRWRSGVPTKKYNVKFLVWYEHHHTMESAIRREKQLKDWKRAWKVNLIEKLNSDWRDLHNEIDVVSTLVEFK